MGEGKLENNEIEKSIVRYISNLPTLYFGWCTIEEQINRILNGFISFTTTSVKDDDTDYEKMNRVIYL